jgi:hypothetical protein
LPAVPAPGLAVVKLLSAILLLACACCPSAASAYWQRSHWLACSEAPTPAERIRLNCYIFAPAYEWPLVPGYGSVIEAYPGAAPHRPLIRK